MDQFRDGYKLGDVLRDVNSGEFVLLTNGICCLDHSTPISYRACHVDGCRYVPSEGLVFEGLVTWGTQDIRGRRFEKAGEEDARKVKEFYDRRIEEIYQERRRRVRTRR